MKQLVYLALTFFIFYQVFENKANAVLSLYGFRFIALVKSLEYKVAQPDIPLLQRLFWMFPRIFMCSTLYNLCLGELSWEPVIKNFISYMALV